MNQVLIALLLLISLPGLADDGLRTYPPTPEKRELVLHVLKVGPSALERSYDYEEYIDAAIDWYCKGDATILLPLLNAEVDGCNSEALGMFLGKELQQNPELIIKRLSSFPATTQKHAAILGSAADGAGWPPATSKTMRSNLAKLMKSPDPAIRKTAKLWLSTLVKFEKQQQKMG
ncbi:hypothetical protein [Geothrix alkalitolerans]|uniref:hypothetical protein n=1 Tax=Geothrix alkalitolerans TaxID=2922724 RepID=UPI001FAF7B29|nr:hypothetical protein [Geothrix alkalitolerans]